MALRPRQPFQQLQPIVSNENPLNVIIGSPGLRPQFANTFILNFNDYKILTERGIYAKIAWSFTSNDISNSLTVDDTAGRQTTQAVNVNGTWSLLENVGYGFKWKGPDLRFNFSASAQQNNTVTIVDNINNATRSGSYTADFTVWKSKEKNMISGPTSTSPI
jgi:hypothetical protein